MPEQPQDHSLDEQLARFTDRLVNGLPDEIPLLSDQDESLGRLEKTVAQLRRAGGENSAPDPEFARRLQGVLATEWQSMAHSRPAPEQGFWQRLVEQIREGFHSTLRPAAALRLGMAALGVLILLLLVFPSDAQNLTGAAGLGDIGGVIAIGVLAVVVVGGIVWHFRRKR